ncbi:hypothetical protein Scep_007194 [Stephania cephalantha]|uniref:Uncharacterized protein n=1 Tax=Stephania cephalantha TaxID=152367 RepID=A0AAP0K9L3_9MAGN
MYTTSTLHGPCGGGSGRLGLRWVSGGRPRPVLVTATTCTRNKCDEQQQKQREMKRNVSREGEQTVRRGESGRVLTGERECVRPPATFLATTDLRRRLGLGQPNGERTERESP